LLVSYGLDEVFRIAKLFGVLLEFSIQAGEIEGTSSLKVLRLLCKIEVWKTGPVPAPLELIPSGPGVECSAKINICCL
jgi:hypothetical protein